MIDTFWLKYRNADLNGTRFSRLEEDSTRTVFRFWFSDAFIEIEHPPTKISATLTVFATPYKAQQYELTQMPLKMRWHTLIKERVTPSHYYQTIKLSSDSALWIYNRILNSGVLNMPSGGEIPCWSDGCDGTIYQVEQNSPSVYRYAKYWTPSVQENCLQADTIDSLIRDLTQFLEITQRQDAFYSTLPRGEYSIHQGFVRMVISKRKRHN